jgi:hypothetical protein
MTAVNGIQCHISNLLLHEPRPHNLCIIPDNAMAPLMTLSSKVSPRRAKSGPRGCRVKRPLSRTMSAPSKHQEAIMPPRDYSRQHSVAPPSLSGTTKTMTSRQQQVSRWSSEGKTSTSAMSFTKPPRRLRRSTSIEDEGPHQQEQSVLVGSQSLTSPSSSLLVAKELEARSHLVISKKDPILLVNGAV